MYRLALSGAQKVAPRAKRQDEEMFKGVGTNRDELKRQFDQHGKTTTSLFDQNGQTSPLYLTSTVKLSLDTEGVRSNLPRENLLITRPA
jgi:hypothetical protein